MKNNSEIPFSQRQLRVGELVKQNLDKFLEMKTKIPTDIKYWLQGQDVYRSKSARVYLTGFNNSSLDDF